MIWHGGKQLMIFRYTKSLIGWMDVREQNIEQAVEFALANKTDVTNLNSRVLCSRIRLPKRMAKSRMRYCKLCTKSIIMCH